MTAIQWISEHARKYAVPLGCAAGSFALWYGDSEGYHHMGRFPAYVAWGAAWAEGSRIFWEGKLGRNLTPYEKVIAYGSGAALGAMTAEGWEHYGAEHPVSDILESLFGHLAREDFEGKGSIADAWKSVLLTGGAMAAKEGLKSAKEYVSDRWRRPKQE